MKTKSYIGCRENSITWAKVKMNRSWPRAVMKLEICLIKVMNLLLEDPTRT
uniref:Uncharacterized protein n=1 Tax=Solanum tuberosum TaxID=4113 RepID=M1C935_SOLTU